MHAGAEMMIKWVGRVPSARDRSGEEGARRLVK